MLIRLGNNNLEVVVRVSVASCLCFACVLCVMSLCSAVFELALVCVFVRKVNQISKKSLISKKLVSPQLFFST